MNRIAVFLFAFVILAFGAMQVSAQSDPTPAQLAKLIEYMDKRLMAAEDKLWKQGVRISVLEEQVVELELEVISLQATPEPTPAPTLTPTPRPTRTPRPTSTPRPTPDRRATVQARITATAEAKARVTPTPAATLSPAMQAALDESAANQWANAALDKARGEKGLDWRMGGWMGWYNRPNIVKIFMEIVDRCDLTGEELIAEIEKYERDRTVIAMNKEYEPNITNELAIFRDYNRAAGNNMKPCSKLVEQFKGLYKKEQE